MTNNFNSLPGWVHFLDGPAGKIKFYVQRAPILLRLVESVDHKWDVLDLLEDTPMADEEVFVYRQASWVHVRANKREDSGYHYNYTHVPITSDLKTTLRYNDRWQDWARMQAIPRE